MKVDLNAVTQTVTFTYQGNQRELPFAQFGEMLLNGAPGTGTVASWVTVGTGRQVGVTSAGMLRLRQAMAPAKAELLVLDYGNYGLNTDNGSDDRWQELVEAGIIRSSPHVKPNATRQVVIKGTVPARTWEVEFGFDSLIRDTIIWHGDWRERPPTQWRLGNVNEGGHICWGDNPPVWKPTTTIEEIDFFFLTGSAFNTDWQASDFQWTMPEQWMVYQGRVLFGVTGDPDEWTFGEEMTETEKAEVRDEQVNQTGT